MFHLEPVRKGGGDFWNGSAHLGSHCEEGFPFWWRLTWYLLQDHGNSLICSPRVFPLQQWNQQRLVSGQLDNSVLFAHVEGILQKRLYLMMMTILKCVWGCLTTKHRLKTFPQDYGNEKRVTAQCREVVDRDEHVRPQQCLSTLWRQYIIQNSAHGPCNLYELLYVQHFMCVCQMKCMPNK